MGGDWRDMITETVKCGEIAGAGSATQMPDIAVKLVRFTAVSGNAGSVYIGGVGVTIPDGSTDTTSGLELEPGDATGWMPVPNLNILYYICDNAGDDITYLGLL